MAAAGTEQGSDCATGCKHSKQHVYRCCATWALSVAAAAAPLPPGGDARAVTRSRLREALTKQSEGIKAATAAIVAGTSTGGAAGGAAGGGGRAGSGGLASAGSSGATSAAPPLSLKEALGVQATAFLSK